MSLEQALTTFTQTFAGSAKHFGTVQLRDPHETASSLALGAALSAFYARVCLVDRPQVGGVMQLRLFAPGDDLLGAQQGWRWIRNRAGAVIENPDWKSSWIVMADRNGDALFVDTESPAGAQRMHAPGAIHLSG